jgi:hypothetical protein
MGVASLLKLKLSTTETLVEGHDKPIPTYAISQERATGLSHGSECFNGCCRNPRGVVLHASKLQTVQQ